MSYDLDDARDARYYDYDQNSDQESEPGSYSSDNYRNYDITDESDEEFKDDAIPTEPTNNSDIDLNDLVEKTIKDRVFSQVDFADKNFTGTTFENVTFSRAVFTITTIFENTKFINCNLVNVDFNGSATEKISLEVVEFENCKLRKITFNYCKFDHLIMFKCEFSNEKNPFFFSKIPKTEFNNCSFSNIIISECNFSNVIFRGEPDFRNDHENSENIIEKTHFIGSVLKGAKFDGLELNDLDFGWAVLDNSTFNGSVLNNVDYTHAELNDSKFIETTITDASFLNARMQKATLKFTQDKNGKFVSFEQANLTGADFSHSTFQNFNFKRADLTESIFENSTLKNGSFEDATLLYVDFQDTVFGNVNFDDSNLKELKIEEVNDDEKHKDVYLEEYTIKEYIEEDKEDNIVLKFDKMIVLTKKSILKELIKYGDCDNGIVYICKEVSTALTITRDKLKDETPYLNMRRIGPVDGIILVEEIEYVIQSCKHYFTTEKMPKEYDAPSVVSFSVYRPECSRNVVSRSHCQAGQEQGVYKIKPFKPKFVTSEQMETSPKTPRLVSSLKRDEVSRPQKTSPRTQRTIPTTPPRSLRTDGIVARRRMPTPTSSSLPLLDIERIPRTPSPDLDIPRSRNPSFSDDESNGDRLGGGRGRRNRTTKTKRLNKKKTHKLKSFRIRLRTKKGKHNKMRKTHKKRKYYKQR